MPESLPAVPAEVTLLSDLDALGLVLSDAGVVEASPFPALLGAKLVRIDAPPALLAPPSEPHHHVFARISEQVPVTLCFHLVPGTLPSSLASTTSRDGMFRVMGDEAALAGRLKDAVEEYTTALSAAADNFLARANRCVVNTLLNNLDAARTDAQVLVSIAPKVPLSYVLSSRVAQTVTEACFWLCQGVELLSGHATPLLLRLERLLQSQGEDTLVALKSEQPGKLYICVARAPLIAKVSGVKIVEGKVMYTSANGASSLELQTVNGLEGARWEALAGVAVFAFAPALRLSSLVPGVKDAILVSGAGFAPANGLYISQATRNEAPSYENEHGMLLSREAGDDGRCAWIIGDPLKSMLAYVLDPKAHPGSGHWLCLDAHAHAPSPCQVVVLEGVLPPMRAIEGGSFSESDMPAPLQAVHLLLALKGYGLRIAQEGFFERAAPCLQAVADQALALALADDVKGLGPIALEARVARLACLAEMGQDVSTEARALAKALHHSKTLTTFINDLISTGELTGSSSGIENGNHKESSSAPPPTLLLGNGIALAQPKRRTSSSRRLKLESDDKMVVVSSPSVWCWPSRPLSIAKEQCARIEPGPGAKKFTIVTVDGAEHVFETKDEAQRDALVAELKAWAKV